MSRRTLGDVAPDRPPAGAGFSRPLVLGLILVGAGGAFAQEKTLSIEAIYDPDQRVSFSGSPPSGLRWIDAEHYLWTRRTGGDRQWLKVHARTGETTTFLDVSRVEAALVAAGVRANEASAAANGAGLIFNADRSALMVTVAEDLYLYELAPARVTRLTTAAGAEEDPTFSPDSAFVAFTRGHNLFTVEIARRRERQLTSDGGPQILNGRLDWLYQEEIYGRGSFRGYWWSPDSARLAFLRLDERPVPEFAVIDHIPARPGIETTDYPNAGDPNPLVQLGVVKASGGSIAWADLGAYSPDDTLIVDVDWSPDSGAVYFQVQNREQTVLDLYRAEASNGRARPILRETTPAWVNVLGGPTWLEDGSFLWLSERSGFRHLYRYAADGTPVNALTSGRWDVRTLHGVDERGGWIYYTGTAHSPIGRHVYRVRLDGGEPERLSKAEGTHRATFNPDFSLYLDSWGAVLTPTQVRLHAADGSEVRVIDENPAPALAEYGLARPEFLQVPARDGFAMEAMLIKPRHFDPARRYPVYQHTYAGPGAQSVLDVWMGSEHLFLQLLAQSGFVVWVCDNRSASGKGAESQWPIYGRLGEVELRDIEDGLAWLRDQPWVDPARIAIGGWSYGGYMAGYALTHSTSFAAAVIGAPVTDWRNYDSVYTERYMQTPQRNPAGYDRSSVVEAAADAHGRALIVHGTIDDNVHVQNTMQLVYALQRAGKTFEVMIYPRSRHGVSDPRQYLHLQRLTYDFLMRTVGTEPVAGASSRAE
ncbi:MAG: S9 family peptidase [Acidimicrobiia bacterium]|nr:S9 family peptidase [Acidimicrobiia bacterium]